MKVFRYGELVGLMRKGFRNGNWVRMLSIGDRAYFRASLSYAKVKGKIVNSRVVSLLLPIVERLKTTRSTRILRLGVEKAFGMLRSGGGVFTWCPRLRVWLMDRKYVFWLGLMEMSNPQQIYMP